MTKYCINCKHYFTPEEMIYGVSRTYTAPRAPKYALCRAVEAPKSLVTGEPIGDAYVMCSAARIHPCGEDAKFYVEKTDKPQRAESFIVDGGNWIRDLYKTGDTHDKP